MCERVCFAAFLLFYSRANAIIGIKSGVLYPFAVFSTLARSARKCLIVTGKYRPYWNSRPGVFTFDDGEDIQKEERLTRSLSPGLSSRKVRILRDGASCAGSFYTRFLLLPSLVIRPCASRSSPFD